MYVILSVCAAKLRQNVGVGVPNKWIASREAILGFLGDKE
jgi:hypothetical protein